MQETAGIHAGIPGDRGLFEGTCQGNFVGDPDQLSAASGLVFRDLHGVSFLRTAGSRLLGSGAIAGGDFRVRGYAAAAGGNGNQRGPVFKNISLCFPDHDPSGNGSFQGTGILQPAADQRRVYGGGTSLLYYEKRNIGHKKLKKN